MKGITNLILKLLSILTIVAQVIFSLAGIGVVFATIMMFVISGNDKSDFYKYILEPGNLTTGNLLLGCLNTLIIFICLIIMMPSLRRVINNINARKFFVQANLTNIKIMLGSVSILTVANIISMYIFANSWSQIGIYVIFIAILYTIYLVFKYGVELQDDVNTVI